MKKQNFNLVEIIIAMGIVVVCITTIMGMYSVGLKASKDAVFTSYANNIIEQIGGMIETHPNAKNAVPDTQSYTNSASDETAAKTAEDNCTTQLDSSDPFFQNVFYDGSSMETLKVIFKTSIGGAQAEDFTAFVKLYWEATQRDINTSDASALLELDDSKTLHIEITWPHHLPYRDRILLDNRISFQRIMRP